MSSPQRTRILFVDDSGNPSPRYHSDAFVIGGFSVASGNVPKLESWVSGAKRRFYANRGRPERWELKATQTVSTNNWKRSKNRKLVAEIVRILTELDATVYTVSIDKRRQKHPMSQRQAVAYMLQVLAEHFSVECDERDETGLIVSDWSNHRLDAQSSQSVAGFVINKRLALHASIYYANSRSSQAIQAADLISGIRRRTVEGDLALEQIEAQLAAIRSLPSDLRSTTHAGRPYNNRIDLI